MARYYRRRYTKIVRPKKKWASCIAVWKNKVISSPFVVTLAANSTQPSTPTPSVLKVGNFKVTLDSDVSIPEQASIAVNAVIYILFKPEGIANANVADLVTQHPEYIMATKVVGASLSSGTVISLETINVSTRMKRNLNSGDEIVMLVDFAAPDGVTSIIMTGNVRYWACTN